MQGQLGKTAPVAGGFARSSRRLAVALGGLCSLALASGPWAAETERRFLTQSFPPYTDATAQGQATGPMVAVLQAACAQLRWRCRVEVLPWRRALREAERGLADGVFAVRDIPERRAAFYLSAPVVDGRYALFAKAGNDFLYDRQPGQLAGRTVGVYGPSATLEALQELAPHEPGLRIQIEPDNLTVLRKLAAGRYGPKGLALVNEYVALNLIRESDMSGLQTAGTLSPFSYAFGLSRARVSEADYRAFNAVLVRLCRSGQSANLIKPFGVPASACAKAD